MSTEQTTVDPALNDREKPSPPFISNVDDEVSDGPFVGPQLSPAESERIRLTRKPNIDHLEDGTIKTLAEGVLPLFSNGDRIVAERMASCLPGNPWLDTRVYIVKSIDDETGEVRCVDEELVHYACIGYRSPFTRIKLVPRKMGNPFKVPVKRTPRQVELDAAVKPGEQKKRGRPKGSKNRSKAEVQAEKQARKAERQEKLAKRRTGKRLKGRR